MDLKKAKLCVTCDYVYEGSKCPVCGLSVASQWLSKWLKPIAVKQPIEAPENSPA